MVYGPKMEHLCFQPQRGQSRGEECITVDAITCYKQTRPHRDVTVSSLEREDVAGYIPKALETDNLPVFFSNLLFGGF
jgi:hypothetical protein